MGTVRDRERAAPVCFAGWLAVACSLCAEGTALLPRSPAGDPRQPRGSGPLLSLPCPSASSLGPEPAQRGPTEGRFLRAWGRISLRSGAQPPAPRPVSSQTTTRRGGVLDPSSRGEGEAWRITGSRKDAGSAVPGSRSQSRASSTGASPTCVSRHPCLCVPEYVPVCICVSVCS